MNSSLIALPEAAAGDVPSGRRSSSERGVGGVSPHQPGYRDSGLPTQISEEPEKILI